MVLGNSRMVCSSPPLTMRAAGSRVSGNSLAAEWRELIGSADVHPRSAPPCRVNLYPFRVVRAFVTDRAHRQI